jgi:hypothetical protein
MTTLKSYFTEKSQMFKGFFLLLKVFYVGSALMLIKLCVEMAQVMLEYKSFELSQMTMMIPTLIILGAQFIATIYADKAIREDNPLGLVIGLILSLLMTFSFFFPVGLFGFFALLNRDFRNDYLVSDRPLWLSSLYEQLDQWTSPKRA